MVFPKARLIVFGCLFVGWLGFLAWLVAQTRNPVILSRTQFLAANLYVVADVPSCQGWPCPDVTITEVAWTARDLGQLKNKQIMISGLADCGPKNGWAGAGKYILALTHLRVGDKDTFQVTPLPATPGYVSKFVTMGLDAPGPNPEKLANLLATHLPGVTPDQARAIVKAAPAHVKHNVPVHEGLLLMDAAKKAGAVLQLQDVETRIYPLTADSREQLRELAAER
jgi:hypothetical protein